MNQENRIAAGIVLYNPDIERLRENILAILPQVDALYLVDNASSNRNEVDTLLEALNLTCRHNPSNIGIASALNQLMHQGEENGMNWVLTLDQDSVCPADLIAKMRSYTQSCPRVGILCPVIDDCSFGIEHPPSPTEETTIVKECITSASLTRIEAWRETGGFDERLFIDAVDTDFCLSLQEKQWEVVRVNAARLIHEIGHAATQHIVLGRSYIAFNHAPIRYYYIARNMVFLSRKHQDFLKPSPWRCILTMLARMCVILLWERECRWMKCCKIMQGIWEGCRMQIAQ